MTKKIIIGFFLTIFILVYIFFPDRIFIFNPLIDTRFSTSHTYGNFKYINIGMDTTQVEKLLGKPMAKYYDIKNNNYTAQFTYSSDGACEWWGFAWLGVYVQYDENFKVCKKGMSYRYD